mmetsp:Transcript_29857/g.68814  ORF Transcript_29857/g.68814 Transcript_29857/m.68814 type:complete len:403 (+) Transcript_29857:302-1510(+)
MLLHPSLLFYFAPFLCLLLLLLGIYFRLPSKLLLPLLLSSSLGSFLLRRQFLLFLLCSLLLLPGLISLFSFLVLLKFPLPFFLRHSLYRPGSINSVFLASVRRSCLLTQVHCRVNLVVRCTGTCWNIRRQVHDDWLTRFAGSRLVLCLYITSNCFLRFISQRLRHHFHGLLHWAIIWYLPSSLRWRFYTPLHVVCPHLITSDLWTEPPPTKVLAIPVIPEVQHHIQAVGLHLLLVGWTAMVLRSSCESTIHNASHGAVSTSGHNDAIRRRRLRFWRVASPMLFHRLARSGTRILCRGLSAASSARAPRACLRGRPVRGIAWRRRPSWWRLCSIPSRRRIIAWRWCTWRCMGLISRWRIGGIALSETAWGLWWRCIVASRRWIGSSWGRIAAIPWRGTVHAAY